MASINSNSQRISIYACTNLQSPSFHRAMGRGSGDAGRQQFSLPEKNREHRESKNLCSTKKTLAWSSKAGSTPAFFPQVEDIIPALQSWQHKKSWKEVYNSQCFYTQDVQRCKRHITVSQMSTTSILLHVRPQSSPLFMYACIYV